MDNDPQRQKNHAEDHLPEAVQAPSADASAAAPTLDEALRQIAELNKKVAETTDKMLRALAEAENTRRRAERERQDTAKFSVSSFARDLLTVSDNLRRALNAIPAGERDRNEQLKSIFTGVEATERELLRVFESNGIKKIDPLNQKFDPNLHEVLFEAPAEGKPSGTIIQVVEPGYMIHERLLRPARVGVAKNDGGGGDKKVDQSV
jgi:molecular chaperone GrpE